VNLGQIIGHPDEFPWLGHPDEFPCLGHPDEFLCLGHPDEFPWLGHPDVFPWSSSLFKDGCLYNTLRKATIAFFQILSYLPFMIIIPGLEN
jgi:hypothetical protein